MCIVYISFPFVFSLSFLCSFTYNNSNNKCPYPLFFPPLPLLLLLLFFFAAFFASSPLTDLIVPNIRGGFTLEGRRGAFSGVSQKSLILGRGVADGVMDVYALCVCCCVFAFFFLILFFVWMMCGVIYINIFFFS
jgi:hypothetical protein